MKRTMFSVLAATIVACGSGGSDGGAAGSSGNGSSSGGSTDPTVDDLDVATQTVAHDKCQREKLELVATEKKGTEDSSSRITIRFLDAPKKAGDAIAFEEHTYDASAGLGATETLQSTDKTVFVELQRLKGSLDKTKATSITLTILAFPTSAGDPLTVRLELGFADGRKLDETLGGPRVEAPCAPG